MDGVSALTDANAALDRGAGADALAALLEAWRQTRAPEIAVLVENLSPRIERPPLPKSKTQKQHLLDWIARARQKDAADLGVLLAELQVIAERGRPSQVVPAIDELLERPQDPRLGHRCVAMLAEQVTRGSLPAKLWRRLTKMIIVTADPTTLEPLRDLPQLAVGNFYLHGLLRERLPPVLTKLEKRLAQGPAVQPLTAEAARLCVVLGEATLTAALDPSLDVREESTRSHEELLAGVFEKPADDGLRMVLADALLEAGDVRGEFISLQLSRVGKKPKRSAMARERELIRQHGTQWIGGLSRITNKGSLRFARGFVVDCKLKTVKAARAAAEIGHREWATVERVVFSAGVSGWGTVISPHMRSMRVLVDVCQAGLVALCAHHADLPIEQLVVYGHFNQGDSITELESLAACQGLAALRVLQVPQASEPDRGRLDGLWLSDIGQRLDTLVLHGPSAGPWLEAWHEGQVPVRRLAIRAWDRFWMAERIAGELRLAARFGALDTNAEAVKYNVRGVLRQGGLERYASAVMEVVGDDAHETVIREVMRELHPSEVDKVVFRTVRQDDPCPWDIVPEGIQG